MSTDRINADEALRVIDEMLVHTRRKTAVAGEFFIAWGIIIFLATGLMWLLHELGLYRFIWVNWLSAMLLGSAYSAWKGRHLKQQTGPVSYSDKAVRGTWIALCIAFFLVNLVVPLAHKSVQPLIVFDAVMGGCGLLITGILLDVKRFVGFALVWWLGGVAMAFMNFPGVLALFMAIIVLGALWPGWYLIHLVHRES
ncbi:hypothetical protein ACFL45_02565 [Candidatus Neomarinimicrobiota bacterium]